LARTAARPDLGARLLDRGRERLAMGGRVLAGSECRGDHLPAGTAAATGNHGVHPAAGRGPLLCSGPVCVRRNALRLAARLLDAVSARLGLGADTLYLVPGGLRL